MNKEKKTTLRDGHGGMTAEQLNQNIERLVQETNMKIQLVLAEFTGRLLELVKESL